MAGVLQLTISYYPIDILGFKTGLGYIFYFAIGYVFEIERSLHSKWNIKKTIVAFGILIVLEIMNYKFCLLDSFFMIIVGSFLTYLLSDILDRIFRNVQESKIWQYLVRNIFYVYIFHDPLEYIVLKVFMKKNLLSFSWGCYLYTFCRTVVVFIIALVLGDIVGKAKKFFGGLFADSQLNNLPQ